MARTKATVKREALSTEEPSTMPKPASKKIKRIYESSESSEEEPSSSIKKPRPEDFLQAGNKRKQRDSSPEVQSDNPIKLKANSEGDKYLELGKSRRATIRSFKGTPLIDIREFYTANDEEKPGKKGISLTFEQWETLKSGMSVLDKQFAAIKK